MKYAVVQIGGKQIKIKEGDTFEIERQHSLVFDVLMFSEDGNTEVGSPFLKNIEVKAKNIEEKRADKIRIGRFKSKSRYRRVKGHKQPLSVILIESIGKKGAKVKDSEEKPKTKIDTKAEKSPKKPTKAKAAAKKTTEKKAPVKKTTKKGSSSTKKGVSKK